MQVYKLFYQNSKKKKFHFSKLNSSVITGSSEVCFGLKIEPERYKEFLKNISQYLLKNIIHQHIMTDYKFVQLICHSKFLNFELTDINFYGEEHYQNDELVQELKEALWYSDVNEILELLQEALDSGYKIFSITGNIKINEEGFEQIKIYANGTISIESKVQEGQKYPIIDYLIKGPEVLL